MADYVTPIAVPMARAPAVTGLSRSAIYRAASAGQIVLRKLGRTTLVDLASAREYVSGLPRAEIRPAPALAEGAPLTNKRGAVRD